MTQMNAVTTASTSSPQCLQQTQNSPESGKDSVVGSVESVKDRSHLFLDIGSKRSDLGFKCFGNPRRNANRGINGTTTSLADTFSPMLQNEFFQIYNAVMSPANSNKRPNFSLPRSLAQSVLGNNLAKSGISSNNLIADTPTPTKILYPKQVTQDQQEFADGFTKALEEIQQKNQFSNQVNNLTSPTANLLLPLLAQLTPTLSNPPPLTQPQNTSPISSLLNVLTPTPTRNQTTEQLFSAFASLVGTPTGVSPTTPLPVPTTTTDSTLNISTSSTVNNNFPTTTTSANTSQLMDNMFTNHPDFNNIMTQFNHMPTHSTQLLQHNYHQNGMSQMSQVQQPSLNIKSEPSTNNTNYNLGTNNGICQPPPQMCPPSTSHHVDNSQTYTQSHHRSSTNDEQERRKLERKRARNRMAASKCRQRKIERIQQLENEVQHEKQRYANLQQSISNLEKTINMLQSELARHKNAGCSLEKTTVHLMNHLNTLMPSNNVMGIDV